jgi:hypothetical protein
MSERIGFLTFWIVIVFLGVSLGFLASMTIYNHGYGTGYANCAMGRAK